MSKLYDCIVRYLTPTQHNTILTHVHTLNSHLSACTQLDPHVLMEHWARQLTIANTAGFLAMVAYVALIPLPPIQVAAALVAANLYTLARAVVRSDIIKQTHANWHLTQNTIHAPMTSERTAPLFAVKSHPGAVAKVNMTYRAMRRAIGVYSKQFYAAMRRWEQSYYVNMLYDDQAAGVALLAVAYDGVFESPIELAATLVLSRDLAKELTNTLKGLGANGSTAGAMLCEVDTVRGRAVDPVDPVAELERRTDPAKLECYTPDDESLRAAIRMVLSEELPEQYRGVQWEDVDHFWARRCAHTSNGAHHDDRFVCRCPNVVKNTRRSAMEQVTHNLITAWDGTATFSFSEKLEHGKSRALFSSDTSCYYAFSHLLTTVERKWMNRRVVLDPGDGGTVGMVDRLRRAAKRVHLMLDYTDFNSQHTLSAQKMVIEETCIALNYPRQLAAKLIDSFDNMYITGVASRGWRVPGRRVKHRVVGTLMSGHRATSYINSVLNRAYLLTVAPWLQSTFCVHVGDDVYIGLDSVDSAAHLICACHNAGIRLNPVKQSVGTMTFEFLRTATCANASHMYVARGVASFVSGSWISDYRLSADEATSNMVRAAWTFANRTGDMAKSRVFAAPIAAILKVTMDDAVGIAGGTVSINGSPIRYTGPMIKFLATEKDKTESNIRQRCAAIPLKFQCATRDYIEKCQTADDRIAIYVTGVIPTYSMLGASYARALTSYGGVPVSCRTLKMRSLPLRVDAHIDIAEIDRTKVYNPIYPSFIADVLIPSMTEKQVAQFMVMSGHKREHIAQLRKSSRIMPTVVTGWVPFSDAMAVDTGTRGTCVITSRHAYLC